MAIFPPPCAICSSRVDVALREMDDDYHYICLRCETEHPRARGYLFQKPEIPTTASIKMPAGPPEPEPLPTFDSGWSGAWGRRYNTA